MSTAPARPETEAAPLLVRWDAVAAWLLIVAGVVLAVVAWDTVFNGLDLLALQAVIIGAALIPTRSRA